MINKKKIFSIAKKAGKITIQNALTLYYTLNSDASVWVKVIIATALAYLVNPIDSIPDLTPVLGFTDDLGILITALSVIAVHIKDEYRRQARQDADTIFNKHPS
jgi:uncharacterized membrane protein YkvA (DUF1232 family)